jgi:leucyl aminopeptidase
MRDAAWQPLLVMKITVSSDKLASLAVDLVVFGTTSTKLEKNHPLKVLDTALGKGKLEKLFKDEGFKAKRGQTFRIQAPGRMKAGWVVVVGLDGIRGEGEVAYQLAAAAVRACRGQKSVGVFLGTSEPNAVQNATEGALSAAYRYTAHRSKKPDESHAPRAVTLVLDRADAEQKKAVTVGKTIAEAVSFARDLVNAPPNEMHPVRMAELAKEDAEARGYSVKIWDKAALEALGMPLLLAVNKGSAIEPRMIHVAHRPKSPKKRVVFVGKGLTFDSGGLCIKPAGSMVDMKCDMAGAATTLGIVQAASRLNLPIEVHGIIGSTENMTGPHAYRPGDVYPSYLGKTVEIINTDAEGRLVLADVLAWATKELSPDYLIDHATLTGACMIALGNYRAGLFSNDDELADSYVAAAEGEDFWRLPLDPDLRPQLDSTIADIKHTGSRYGGTITAALFLKEFVGDTKWMHLDIAGPAFLERAHGRHPKGGTGFGVATGVRFLRNLAERT